MAKEKKKLTPYAKNLISMILGSATNTFSMLFAIGAAGNALTDNLQPVPILSFFSFFFLAVYYFQKVFSYRDNKVYKWRFATICGVYLMFAILVLFAVFNIFIYFSIAVIYLVISIVNRIFIIIKNHKLRSIILNGLIIALSTLTLIIVAPLAGLGDNYIMIIYAVALLLTVAVSFVSVMFIVFSRFRRKTLIHIIRKTYAIEILYGLFILLVAVSVMLTMIEPEMENFGDALWYCFALVTTIGFGDIKAVTIVGRVLSVVLGIYGIIVVALITSIIVNLYNENATRRNDKKELIDGQSEGSDSEEDEEEKLANQVDRDFMD